MTSGDFIAGSTAGATASSIDAAFGGPTAYEYNGVLVDAPPETGAYDTATNRQQLAIYGTGTESGGGWAKKFNGIANASIGKINGVALASIGKVNGV